MKKSTQGQQYDMLYLQSVCEKVGVGHAPVERPELHDRNEARQVQDLPLHVLAILHATQVEQLGACYQHTPCLCMLVLGGEAKAFGLITLSQCLFPVYKETKRTNTCSDLSIYVEAKDKRLLFMFWEEQESSSKAAVCLWEGQSNTAGIRLTHCSVFLPIGQVAAQVTGQQAATPDA